MPQSLQEYAVWLNQRDDLIWPKVPKAAPVAAKAYDKPLAGIKAVVWNLYGTLLRVTDGELLLSHHLELRMQVALEKTISEFNMWNSMTRKPGAPWEYILPKYRAALEDIELTAKVAPGDFGHANGSAAWRRILDMLGQKEYQYDEDFYGSLDQLSEKIAYFFQLCLQGVEAAPNAAAALVAVSQKGLVQGLLTDAQPFSLIQALRAFRQQTKLPPLNELFDPACLILSCQVGARKPSPTLYDTCLQRFAAKGIQPEEILYVGNRLQSDLAVAKQLGVKTALYVGDKLSLKASSTEINNKNLRPKRLLTDLKQISNIVGQ
jgi:FMN phosphatase YigB (HAD superfamily)